MKLLEEYNGIKVGDYIIGHERNNGILLTTIEDYGNGFPIFECENNIRLRFYAKECKKWIPKDGEWCCFSNYEDCATVVAQFLIKEKDEYLANISDGNGCITLKGFKYCKPFNFKR